MRLWCCRNFLQEIKAVLAASPSLSGLDIETFTSSCRQNMQNSKKLRRPLSPGAIAQEDPIIGGGCLWGEIPSGNPALAPRLCFYLVAPAAMVDDLIAAGAYLMTPGWLQHWQGQMADWGFDQNTARQFFQETIKKLVLLDTGVHPDSQAELSTMGDYLDLPVQSIPVGLDMLSLSLEHLAADLGQKRKAQPPPDHFFADHLMVIDLMTVLLASKSEHEAIDHIEELFRLLFAPGALRYIAEENGHKYQYLQSDKPYAWAASGRGFTIPLTCRKERLGVLEIDELTFAEYKERYLTLALALAKVCAMAISNARIQEARQRSEQALRRMARIVESSDDAIIGMTLEGIIVSWNKGADRLYGYKEDEVLDRHISFLTPQSQPDEMPRMLEHIKAGRQAEQVETAWATKQGDILNVSLQVSPIRDHGDRIVGASTIARDISAAKQKLERERQALEAQLQQSQKLESVGRLAGGVAHDFNNMLAVIMGYSQICLEMAPEGGEMYRNLEEVLHAAERAEVLTRQLLAFARKQVLEMRKISLNTVIENFSRMIARLIGEDIAITMKLEDDLPQINADRAMMEQILLNLAVNARDAMPQGGALTIETKAVHLDETYAATKFEVKSGDYVMLAVTDTGTGMDEKTRRMIFEPFFTTKATGKGTGLGLATVYGIVNQHGGTIWVYSEPGRGSIFKIYFPASPVRQDPVRIQPAAEIPRRAAGGETILVVEDEEKLRRLLCSLLERVGYTVLAAGSPAEAQAIEKDYTGIIHLMLTDVVMPGMNGKALYDILAPSRPEMKSLFMSGYTEGGIAEKGVLKEGINFIQKPFSTKELRCKLSSILAGENGP
jgi:PAS domain S-box-containing protein